MIFAAHGMNIMGGKVLVKPIIVLLAIALLLIIGTAFGRRRQVHHDAAGAGLFGVTGRMGAGKSYFLTWMAFTALQRKRPVFATYELKGGINWDEYESKLEAGEPWFGPVLVDNWQQIIRVPNHSMVIVDEAHGWWPSAAYRSPVEVNMWISTLRHRGITFFWATQWVDSVAKWLRALSFGIWECENYKVGHRYTLFHPRKIYGAIGKREYEARIVVKRKQEVMDLYDTHNDAHWSVEWSGEGATLTKTLEQQHTATEPHEIGTFEPRSIL